MHLRRTLLMIVACFAASCLASLVAGAAPEKARTSPRLVMIIRHAEKPPEESKSVNLSKEGKERAEALPRLFEGTGSRSSPFPTPNFIFATKDSKHSHRPVETVAPLAKKLGLTINAEYADADYGKLAEHLFHDSKYAGKTILICWHHGMIPQLAEKLGATSAPDKWNGSVFDRVWNIRFDSQGKCAFENLPQHLLPGDSEK